MKCTSEIFKEFFECVHNTPSIITYMLQQEWLMVLLISFPKSQKTLLCVFKCTPWRIWYGILWCFCQCKYFFFKGHLFLIEFIFQKVKNRWGFFNIIKKQVHKIFVFTPFCPILYKKTTNPSLDFTILKSEILEHLFEYES
jgi:hypothetical protein